MSCCTTVLRMYVDYVPELGVCACDLIIRLIIRLTLTSQIRSARHGSKMPFPRQSLRSRRSNSLWSF